jgi:hypothetical protein
MSDKRTTADLMSSGYSERMRASKDAWEGRDAMLEDRDRRRAAQPPAADRIYAFGERLDAAGRAVNSFVSMLVVLGIIALVAYLIVA